LSHFLDTGFYIYPSLTCIIAFFFLKIELSSQKEIIDINNNEPQKTSNTTQGSIIFSCILLFLALSIYYQSATTYPLIIEEHLGILSYKYVFIILANALLVIVLQRPVNNKIVEKCNFHTLVVISLSFIVFAFLLVRSDSILMLILSVFCWTIGDIIIFTILRNIMIKLSNKNTSRNLIVSSLSDLIYFASFYPSMLFSIFIASNIGLSAYQNVLYYSSVIFGIILIMIVYDLLLKKLFEID
jgi:hypothetical protein